jgi:hypothetical protein
MHRIAFEAELFATFATVLPRPSCHRCQHRSPSHYGRKYFLPLGRDWRSVGLSVLQHGPRVSLGCRSKEFLDHAKT